MSMPNNNEQQKMPDSFLTVVFAGEGSADIVSLVPHNVSPMQLYALVGYMQFIADLETRANLAKMEEMKSKNKIVVPGIDVR